MNSAKKLINHFAGKETTESRNILAKVSGELQEMGYAAPFKVVKVAQNNERLIRNEAFSDYHNKKKNNKYEIGSPDYETYNYWWQTIMHSEEVKQKSLNNKNFENALEGNGSLSRVPTYILDMKHDELLGMINDSLDTTSLKNIREKLIKIERELSRRDEEENLGYVDPEWEENNPVED